MSTKNPINKFIEMKTSYKKITIVLLVLAVVLGLMNYFPNRINGLMYFVFYTIFEILFYPIVVYVSYARLRKIGEISMPKLIGSSILMFVIMEIVAFLATLPSTGFKFQIEILFLHSYLLIMEIMLLFICIMIGVVVRHFKSE